MSRLEGGSDEIQDRAISDPAGYRMRTSWPERERSLPYRIIEGDEVFAVHARGGRGVPWRCSTMAFLAEAVVTIDALDPVAARQEFSVADMVALGVYKAPPSDNDEEVFARVLDGLRRLAAHYRGIVDRGLDHCGEGLNPAPRVGPGFTTRVASDPGQGRARSGFDRGLMMLPCVALPRVHRRRMLLPLPTCRNIPHLHDH